MPDNCTNSVSCDCESPFQVTPPHPPPPAVIFWNTEQSATANCPSDQPGSPVTVTIAANSYSSTVSQVDANNIAYAAALAQATAQLNCGLAGQLNGLRWEMPCTGAVAAGVCSCSDPADNSQIASGNPGQTYTVQLRVRGVVECKPYATYGLAGGANQHVFTCANPTQAIPALPAHPENEYCLKISDPPATYFLNNAPGGGPPSDSEKVDYQLTVQIKTGAVVTAKARSIDNLQWANNNPWTANAAPPPIGVTEPYNGEFMQIDVLSIV